MTIEYKKGDLFTAGPEYALAHCISSDIAMGAGIAVKFRDMGVKDALLRMNRPAWNGNGSCIPVTVDNRKVYNLITKDRYWMKPTLDTMRTSLLDLKSQLAEPYLAMPLIGCGLDKLKWTDVSDIIKDVFADTNVHIIVYRL